MLYVDEIILEELDKVKLDYPVLIASRRGIHSNFTVQRCRELEQRGFVEAVSREVTYRITDRGRRYRGTGVKMNESDLDS